MGRRRATGPVADDADRLAYEAWVKRWTYWRGPNGVASMLAAHCARDPKGRSPITRYALATGSVDPNLLDQHRHPLANSS